jgi:hypothetical protein
MHWHLLVLNFDMEEIQVLNSLPHIRDKAKETSLVECIQSCIEDAVDCGLLQTPRPINITRWKKICYTNIPQQHDGYVLHSNLVTTFKLFMNYNFALQLFLWGIHIEVHVVMGWQKDDRCIHTGGETLISFPTLVLTTPIALC